MPLTPWPSISVTERSAVLSVAALPRRHNPARRNGHRRRPPSSSLRGWTHDATQRFGGTVARDVIAVTGACFMSRRSLLLSLGAFSSHFPWSFNDVDLCLKIRRSGYRVIVEPHASLEHRESFTREPLILEWEWDRWIDRWGEVLDPWYHPSYHRPTIPSDSTSTLTTWGRWNQAII